MPGTGVDTGMSEAELVRLYEFVEGGYRHPTTVGRLRKRVSSSLRSVLGRADGGSAPLDRSKLVEPLDAVYRRESLTFLVPTSACRNVALFGFGAGAFDAWQATAKQVAEEPDIPAGDTMLALFAERFRPKTAAERLYSNPREDVPSDSRLWQVDALTTKFFWPWSPSVQSWPDSAPADLRLPSHGPLGERVIELEVWRLKRLVASVKENGYRPPSQDGVRGSLIRLGNETRFLIGAGFHRVAVLGALGHDEVPVGLSNGVQRLMTIDQLPTWPLVRDGLFTPRLAELVFERLFEEDGTQMALRLGLGPGKDDA